MKKSICVYGLNKYFVNKISENLAKKLDMFFVDVDALVQYEIINPNEVLKICGKDYLSKLERSCVKRASSFENSLLSCDHKILNDSFNYDELNKNCLLIFIKMSKENYEKKLKYDKISKLKNILDLFIFDDRSKICQDKAEIVVEVDGLNYLQCANLIRTKIKEYYSNLI